MSTVTIIGTGYVGLTTAVLLAESGHSVYALDIDQERLDSIKRGKSFFYEAGMNNLVSRMVKSGGLIPTDSYQDSIANSNFVFSCVGTPDNPDGSSNLNYIYSSAEESAKYIKTGAIFAQKSTVPVGTGEKLETLFIKLGKKIKYVSNPEFLREGAAIVDSLWPDRVVIGSQDETAAKKVMKLYQDIENNRSKIIKHAAIASPKLSSESKYFITDRSSAELVKVSSNAFLALKISFANSIAKLADQTSADINEVMDIVGADRRIGRAFLSAGRGYGGGCFPKDVTGLISSASKHGIDMQIMVSTADVNESMPGYIDNKVKSALGSLNKKQIAVLGLSFKAGTSDARKSPGVTLANILSHSGAVVKVFDPKANGEAKEELRRNIGICDSIEDAVRKSEAILIATDWPEFLNYEPGKFAKLMNGKLFVDCVNAYKIADIEKAGLKYIGVGRNGKAEK